MSPTPNTTFLRAATRCAHLTQGMTRWRNSAKAAALASGLSAGGGAEGIFSPGSGRDSVCGAAAAGSARLMGGAGGFGAVGTERAVAAAGLAAVPGLKPAD